MSATLSLYSLTLASGDSAASNNPSLRFVDWKRQISGLSVSNPRSEGRTLAPGASATIFDGTRSTTIDGTTELSLSQSTLDPNRYRFQWAAGGGTNPGFRTARATVDLNGDTVTMEIQANGSLVMTAPAAAFTGAVVGDELLIPGPSTGDGASPFSVINQGRWQILGISVDLSTATLVRPSGSDFQGKTETVDVTDSTQVQVYSQDGVQVGDKLEVSAGFATTAQKTYSVEAVTSTYVEVISTSPLAEEEAITPGAAGFAFYTNGKVYVRLEADQDCLIRANGDAGSTQRLTPWVAGDPAGVAEYVKTGPCWSLVVVNTSASPLALNIITAE
jgi:hypothetical protein